MGRKRRSAEKIVDILWQAEIEFGEGNSIAEVCKHLSVSQPPCSACRREHVGLKIDQAMRFKELHQKNARLKRLRTEAERMSWLMVTRGVQEHLRSDSGPTITARVVRDWLAL